ncbi:50S ribosomal protein L35 [Buchnera aphidicola]|uniref:Large ribosomal subunit protein bL35 n=1 Tax=Buchnera aphidicola subsp. Tuberolachnus salignus TaxID=98804 RepID=A0A160SWR9_BUCTT|nr:50S ribosomal protein L35 [Buchnera aphidicola]CUR53068.1 50S ribosomal protein L35 [Buchnera aphidicola (Tuberolachnus salignus)]
MPKIKTIRSVSKRFKKISSGHLKRKQANLRHLLTHKTTHKKRHLRKKIVLKSIERSKILLCIPYL